jgi:hypothetical protein
MESKLLPCPCCGSEPRREPYMADVDDYGTKGETGVVFCRNCGLNIETGCGQDEAESRWNRRNDPSITREIKFVGRGYPPIEPLTHKG